MRPTSLLAAAALAASLLAAAPAREPLASPAAFPGAIQPDPRTGFSSSRRGLAAAFAASYRDAGDRYDPSATPTVFLWDLRAGSLRQLTALGPSDQPSVENGTAYARIGTAREKTRYARTVVAFRSTANLALRNADGSAEIFVWDSQTNAFTQVSDATSGASSDPVIGARFHAVQDSAGLYTGEITVRWRVAFLSTSDLAGDNPDGLPQVFHYDSGAPEVERLVQVSHATDGAAGPPAVEGNGSRVAFVHDGSLVSGNAGPGVFSWDRTRGVRRIGEPVSPASEPALDSGGRWLAWTENGGIALADLGGSRVSRYAPSSGSHGFPTLGKGASPLVCVSTDPGDGGEPVAARPVELRKDGTLREIGFPGGNYGAVRSTRDKRFLFLTSTEDLDGTNAAGREVLFTAGYRP